MRVFEITEEVLDRNIHNKNKFFYRPANGEILYAPRCDEFDLEHSHRIIQSPELFGMTAHEIGEIPVEKRQNGYPLLGMDDMAKLIEKALAQGWVRVCLNVNGNIFIHAKNAKLVRQTLRYLRDVHNIYSATIDIGPVAAHPVISLTLDTDEGISRFIKHGTTDDSWENEQLALVRS
jgi:hypothetical protein